MSPKSFEQVQTIRENKKQQILESALKVFAHNGYEGTTISMIAKEAGIAKGLLYSYYTSKEDLIEQIIVSGLKKAASFLSSNIVGSVDTKESFAAGLRSIVALFTKDTDFWRLYTMLILQANLTEKIKSEMKVFIEQYLGIYMTYFQNKKSPNPHAEAMLFGSVLDGLMFDLMVMPEYYPTDDVIEMIIEKFA